MKILRISILIIAVCFLFRNIDHSVHNRRGRPLPTNIQVPSSLTKIYPCQSIPDTVLDQKFVYLDKGSQAYAFISEDKQYVLKFYKLHIYEPSSFLAYLPFGKWHARWVHQKEKCASTLRSTNTAYEHLKEETGLIYAHLSPSNNLKKTIDIIDRRGRHNLVDLDRTLFVIQKRADLIYPYISERMQKGDVEGAKNALASIFSILERLGRLGVTDNDVILAKNFGFIGNTAAQIDVGKMRIEPTRIGSDIYKNDLFNLTFELHGWLKQNHPELLPHFDMLLATNSQR